MKESSADVFILELNEINKTWNTFWGLEFFPKAAFEPKSMFEKIKILLNFLKKIPHTCKLSHYF